MMEKNVANQKWIVFAFNVTNNIPTPGDAANITANLRIDGGAANAVDDANPAELGSGYYIFDITQAESNGDLILIIPESSTTNIQVIGVPGAIHTSPPNFNALGVASDGDLAKVNILDGHTAQTGDSYPRLGSPAGSSVSDDIAAIEAQTDDIGIAGAGLTNVPWNAAWDAEVESECHDALLGLSLDSLPDLNAAIVADTTELQTDWADGGRLDALVDAIKSKTDMFSFDGDDVNANVNKLSGTASAAAALKATAGTMIVDSVDVGHTETATTLKGGGTATLSGVDNHYIGRLIFFTSGTLQNQFCEITDYAGTSKVFTVTTLTSAPVDAGTFVIV